MQGDSNRNRLPFGSTGQYVAINAGLILDYLSTGQPDCDVSHCQERDIWALEYWSVLESDVRDIDRAGQTTEFGMEKARDFDDHWHTFHTALPFSEAERVWLLRAYQQEPIQSLGDVPKMLGHREEKIVSAGVRRVVSGRDLMGRWRAWRSESGEFREVDTLHVAREALRCMIQIVAPDRPLPASYRALHGLYDDPRPNQEAIGDA
jgi:hypothetical protein